jgi:hypothetical protein
MPSTGPDRARLRVGPGTHCDQPIHASHRGCTWLSGSSPTRVIYRKHHRCACRSGFSPMQAVSRQQHRYACRSGFSPTRIVSRQQHRHACRSGFSRTRTVVGLKPDLQRTRSPVTLLARGIIGLKPDPQSAYRSPLVWAQARCRAGSRGRGSRAVRTSYCFGP